jgi:predicted ribosomally synthesized peptide with SipW-like signal peptide
MKKNRIMASALAVSLAAIMACGSLAYFTASKSITNTFMTASYDPDNPTTADDLFSIRIYENKVENKVATEDVTTEGITYKDILPGDSLPKNPTVENTGKYDAYVRVHITISNANEWEAILDNKDPISIIGGLDVGENGKLSFIDYGLKDDSITYNYYLNAKLASGDKQELFTSVNIPADLTAAELATISKFDIKVTAEAIQADHTGDTPADAFKLYTEDGSVAAQGTANTSAENN